MAVLSQAKDSLTSNARRRPSTIKSSDPERQIASQLNHRRKEGTAYLNARVMQDGRRPEEDPQDKRKTSERQKTRSGGDRMNTEKETNVVKLLRRKDWYPRPN